MTQLNRRRQKLRRRRRYSDCILVVVAATTINILVGTTTTTSSSSSSSSSSVAAYVAHDYNQLKFPHAKRQKNFHPLYQHQQRYYNAYGDDDSEIIPLLEQRRLTDRPTETLTEIIPPNAIPSKPKIVVFGASGLIGRLVVRQLLDSPQLTDGTIVAFVRDYDKACRVLYDDMIASSSSRQKGPKLIIVQGDLVPQSELPKSKHSHSNDAEESAGDDDTNDDKENTKLYPHMNSVIGSSTRNDKSVLELYDDEVLQDVIRDSTIIISCLGTVRKTNLWTDYIVRPLYRILRPNVSNWCYDSHHPYYVHYRSTQKIIYHAEQEQLRRQSLASLDASQDNVNLNGDSRTYTHFQKGSNKNIVPKIRLIRISDLCVTRPPWYLIPILINMFHSMIFRYHYMADQLLERTNHLDTITIRPGDIVDDERDSTTTAIQVSATGFVPYPARISRDDTADVIVAAALWNGSYDTTKDKRSIFKSHSRSEHDPTSTDRDATDNRSFHYTLACRWVGNELDPYPAQGHRDDGHSTGYQCIQSMIGQQRAILQNDTLDSDRITTIHTKKHIFGKASTNIRPYGLCTAIPVYVFLSLLISSLAHNCFGCSVFHEIRKISYAAYQLMIRYLQKFLVTTVKFLSGSINYFQWIATLRSSYRNSKYISF